MMARRWVLLVEDDPDDVFMMTEALKGDSRIVELKTVGDGASALEYLRSGVALPALVLLDWRMPGLGGDDVLRAIRADPRLKLLPVLVLTTSGAGQDVQDAYTLGANCFFKKPTGLDGLRTLVGSILQLWLGHAVLPEFAKSENPIKLKNL